MFFDGYKKLLWFVVTLTVIAGCSAPPTADVLVAERNRARSDDAATVEEAIFHATARRLTISYVRPNPLHIGGAEFRVKRNPAGEGAFVYDPRTTFQGVERYLVWWVPRDGTIYALNSLSKLVTPDLSFPEEPAPQTADVIEYVFRGDALGAPSQQAAASDGSTFSVKEYMIYQAVVEAPVSSETQTMNSAASKYGVTPEQVRQIVTKVQDALLSNNWMGQPEAEIRHASDWNGGQQNLVSSSDK